MCVGTLMELLEYYNIPKEVEIEADTGWVCGAASFDAVFYNFQEKKVCLVDSIFEKDYKNFVKLNKMGE